MLSECAGWHAYLMSVSKQSCDCLSLHGGHTAHGVHDFVSPFRPRAGPVSCPGFDFVRRNRISQLVFFLNAGPRG